MLVVGEVDGTRSARVDEVVADLQAWGPAQATTNVFGFLWAKLGFSAMLAATALADQPMADLIDRYRDVMLALSNEVFAVAARRGVRLERFDAFEPAALTGDAAARDAGIAQLVAWVRGQSKTRSGAWRDIAVRRRPTEAAGWYQGLVREARGQGLPSPHLKALVELLGDVETGRREMSEQNLDELRNLAAAWRQ